MVLNCLLKKWVNFAGGSGSALIRELKFRLLHFRSFSSTFHVKKSNLSLGGTLQLHAACPTTNFRKMWVTAFHHPSSKTSEKKLSELTVCSSSPSFVVVIQTIPEIFYRECLANFPHFLLNRPFDFSKFGFKRSRIRIKL